jgi:hypothetical protein
MALFQTPPEAGYYCFQCSMFRLKTIVIRRSLQNLKNQGTM